MENLIENLKYHLEADLEEKPVEGVFYYYTVDDIEQVANDVCVKLDKDDIENLIRMTTQGLDEHWYSIFYDVIKFYKDDKDKVYKQC